MYNVAVQHFHILLSAHPDKCTLNSLRLFPYTQHEFSSVILHILSKWSEEAAQGHSKFKNKVQALGVGKGGEWDTGWSWREQRQEEEEGVW